MPSTGKRQRLFGMALAAKRGNVPKSKLSPEMQAIVKRITEKKLKELARKK